MKITVFSLLILICSMAVFPYASLAQDTRPMVRLIYFLPSDREPQPDIDEKMDGLIKDVQQVYANLMEAHGFGRKTFRFEAGARGKAVVHHVKGRYTDEHYSNLSWTWNIWEEIDGRFDTSKNIYLAVIDMSSGVLDSGGSGEQLSGVYGRGGVQGGAGGKALIPASSRTGFNTGIAAHELGHAFGLQHDFRSNAKRFLSDTSDWMVTSFCAAEWLEGHRAFNADRSAINERPTITMLPPSLVSPPNVIRLRFKVTDPDGVHQVQLHTPEDDGYSALLGCKRLNGNSNRTVEFVTPYLTPESRSLSLQMIDVNGNLFWSENYPINVTSLLPRPKVISIPDANLAAAMRQEIGSSITTHTLLNLTQLDVPNRGITDLAGLEHAHNLRFLNLGVEYIGGVGAVDSNAVLDISPLLGLTQLWGLDLSNNTISDVSLLSSMTQLVDLNLKGNAVSDVSSLSGLTQLWSLNLSNNAISDISPLLGLTQLSRLNLSNNAISDVSLLSDMAQLVDLNLEGNAISDISWLSDLTQLRSLYLGDNNVTDVSPVAGLTQLRSLYLGDNNVTDVSPVAGLTQLRSLYLGDNNVTDVSPVAGLTQLTHLYLFDNSITDVSPIAELTQLEHLGLSNNRIADVAPVVGLTQLSSLDLYNNIITDVSSLARLIQLTDLNLSNNTIVDVSPLVGLNLTGTVWESAGLYLERNPLGYASINTHIPAMQARGIEVKFDNRTPTTFVKISGAAQQGVVNAVLPLPFVVEVKDQHNRVFAGVPITFAVTIGNGQLSATAITTDANGRAQTRLTFGRTTGVTTVRATAAEVSQSVQFTATAVLLSSSATIVDANLHAEIAEALDKPRGGTLTVADMLTLTTLTANDANIHDLTGLQYAPNLKTLSLDNNNLSEAAPLAALTQLETLSLDNNRLSEVTPLAGLTQLRTLSLASNNFSDISLLEGLPHLKTLDLKGNLLSYPSLHTHIPAIQAGGATVTFSSRTPSTISKISGTHGVAGAALWVIIKVYDEDGFEFSGVPVTFSVTAGGGRLSPLNAITDGTGRARTTLTLGSTPARNTVRVVAAEAPRPVNFTITAIDTDSRVTIRDAALRAKIVDTLGKASNATITAADMLALTRLEVPNANIQNLIGLEHAHNLRELDLGHKFINGELVNSNAVSDFSPLFGLAQLTRLNLSSSSISDVSFLENLTQLRDLNFYNNTISDVSPLANLTQLTYLDLYKNTISDVSPLTNLTQLPTLRLGANTISDVSPLANLTQLTRLDLAHNAISDVSPLASLTQLTHLNLYNNAVSDVLPLAKLNLIGSQWDSTGLHLELNPLNYVSLHTHIPAMQARGIEVKFDPRTPTTLVKISGDMQRGIVDTTLPLPVVVEVSDQQNRAFAGVLVTFTITTGGGQFSTTATSTDLKGRAAAHLTLGRTAGTTTVRVTAADISQPVQFTATAVLPSAPMAVPDAALRTEIMSALGKSRDGVLTITDMLNLTTLTVNNANIFSLIGLQHASNLTTLSLDDNNISDVAPLAGLSQLIRLSLNNNNISDVAPLAALTRLKILSLNNNNISDVSSLETLTHLQTLHLKGNPLRYPSLHTSIPTIQAGGATVTVDLRTPTTLVKFSGAHGVAGAALRIIIEVQDEEGFGVAGVPVTFSVIAGGGSLFAKDYITNGTGRVRTTLTLGATPGINTIQAVVAEVLRPVSFTIVGVDPSFPVTVRDMNLRAKIVETLSKQRNVQLTAGDMLTLTQLDAPNANIQDLTGLEHAHNLKVLNLGGKHISGEGSVNSNTISDYSPLFELAQLWYLNLSFGLFSDVSFLENLTQLEVLYLSDNNISDVSALANLTQLKSLYLYGNNISDVSALANLAQLKSLYLYDNNISDVSALANLAQLKELYLYDNNISDVSALANLTQLGQLVLNSNNIYDVSPLVGLNLTGTDWNSTGLTLQGNPLNYASLHTHIPAMQARGIEVIFDPRIYPALDIISGAGQQAAGGTTLANPFVAAAIDARGTPMRGVAVTFAVIGGVGELTAATATTDASGRAETTLTLGPNPGRHRVQATAAALKSQVLFIAIATTPAARLAADVNNDGVVNIQDLVIVSSHLGQTGQNMADVNGDGAVNIQDLVLVAGELGTAAAAPSAWHHTSAGVPTRATVEQWLAQVHRLPLTDARSQRGVLLLEHLLAALAPKETVLLTNYPNPFNPETWIPYQLAKPTEVTLHIHSVKGELVRTLVLGHQAAGMYQTKSRAAYWDGRNIHGEPVASGIYFYTLSAGDFTATRKLLIRK